jgi:hypothetical protein
MTHGRCFFGLTRSFNPEKLFSSHILYTLLDKYNVFKLACKICTGANSIAFVDIFYDQICVIELWVSLMSL